MSKGIDWASAPEDYPIWVESKLSCEPSGWHCLDAEGSFRDRNGERWLSWQVKAGECVPHYKPEWNGEGLPPVGTACELKFGHWNEWEQCTVLCVGEKMVFVRQVTRSGEIFEGSMNRDGVMFRLIRTAEQIAEDERSDFASALVKDLNIPPANEFNFYYELGERLHKLGYRKQVAP